jgi:hypothetical protein
MLGVAVIGSVFASLYASGLGALAVIALLPSRPAEEDGPALEAAEMSTA